MTLKEAVDHFGSKKALADSLGLVRSTITNWGDEIPDVRQYQIQVITKGKLKAAKKSAA